MASTTAASKPSSAIPHHPPSLSLPPSQFARLQPHAYLLAHLSPPASSNQPSIRANGRAPSQFRITSANAGSLTHANGSAVVRVGDTVAVCGVRAEILHTEDIAAWGVSASSSAVKKRKTGDPTDDVDEEDDSQIRDFDLLVPNLSLSTGCGPGFIPGAAPSTLAQSLSHQLLSLLHTSRLVRAEDLRIWYEQPDFLSLDRHNEEEMETDEKKHSGASKREIKAFWVLYIDVMIISLAGKPFDAAWAAVLAALRDTKLPRAWWDLDNEIVVCSDELSEARKLTLRGMPVASSYSVFEADAAAAWRAVVIPDVDQEKEQAEKVAGQRWILADPDAFEENLCQESVRVVVDKDNGGKTKIVKLEKNGGLAVDKEELRKLVELSTQRWEQIKNMLEGLR
ncbi:hypothetical protein DTO271D3_7549 [Paecilomyces variotii]|nr:hypothetical protein DTO271D3_7549 [Paecilomyces variotii]